MRLLSKYNIILFLLFSLTLTFCTEKSEVNTDDPSNLVVEIVSIDHEIGFVQIQATADNATLYQLYIGSDETPEEVNNTGYFEYKFGGQGIYEFTIRAYGSSGRYVKKNRQVNVAFQAEEIPLNKGNFSPLEYTGYNLVWQNEFNGSQLNTDDWSYETGGGGWGNNELENYRPENAWVGDSVLTIEARMESYGGANYTSARIITKGKQEFQYGRIDIRALLPEGKGIWPALWMLGGNISSVSWPDCGEIDIMEMVGGNDGEYHVYGTLHWEYNNEHADAGGSILLPSSVDNFAEAYHVFSIEWNENLIQFFVDDQIYYTIDITGSDMSEFHQPHFFIFNIAVGGNWPGSPDNSTIFPQQMKVDYVRVFQK